MAFIIQITFLIIQGYMIYKIIRFYMFSPIYIYILFSILTLSFSILYFYFYDDKFSLYNLDFVSSKDFLNIINFYLLSLNSFLFGIIFFYDFSIKKNRLLLSSKVNLEYSIEIKIKNEYKIYIVIYYIFLIFLILLIYGEALFIRSDYISFDKLKGFVNIIALMSFVACILAAIIYNEFKLTSLFLFLLLIFFYLGTGSRIIFIFIITYLIITHLLSKKRGIFYKIRFFVLLFASLFFLAYLIQLRSLPSHGIIPYSIYFFKMGYEVFENFVFNIYYMFVFGIFATIKTLKVAPHDWHIIWININPFPGFLAGWYKYASHRRINIYAPYTTHGEIFKMGKFFTFLFFFFIGLIFTYFEKKIRELINNKSFLNAFILLIFLCLNIIYSFEYNMRSSIRYLYYAYFYIFILYILKLFVKLLKVKPSNDSKK